MLWSWMVDAARAAKQTWASLYRAHAAVLLRQARRLAGAHVDADDVLQDVFLVAHQRIGDVQQVERPGAYLYGILRNVVREHRRRAQRQTVRDENADPPAEMAHAPDETIEQAQRRRRLAQCLSVLPPRQREAIAWVDLEQNTPRVAAEYMGTSEGAVHTLLSRGRKALADAWRSAEAAEQETAA